MRRDHEEAAARLAGASEELTTHESALAELSVRADRVQHTWFGLSALPSGWVPRCVSPASARTPRSEPAPDQ